ncbi:enoyl-CoA hydratase/isomerase family protein [Bradyrhizobium sp. USDA 3364]
MGGSEDLILREQILPGVVRLCFNRPDKLNALSLPMLRLFESHLDDIAADAGVRVVILEGAGGRAFVAGADIEEYRGGRRAEFAAYQFESRRIFDKLEALPKPTIASVRGYALGGGFELALCCDVLLCSRGAQFGLPEGRLGLSPGGGGTQRLTRAVGRQTASEVMLAGWRLSGERAYQLGLAAVCCEEAELDGQVRTRAQAMLKVAPLAQAEMKRLMRQGLDAPLPVAQGFEQEVLLRLYATDDGQEGIDAFLSKREPRFSGK